MQSLDRPAVLKFLSGSGKPVFATLVSLSASDAIVNIGSTSYTVPVSDLESRWFGDYTIFWRLPPAYKGAIRLGTNGEDVQWLASSLADLNGQEHPGIVSYDAKLIRAVKNFQSSEGLLSDGIAGIQTLMRLNTAMGKNVPRLTASNSQNRADDKRSATALDSVEPRFIVLLDNRKDKRYE